MQAKNVIPGTVILFAGNLLYVTAVTPRRDKVQITWDTAGRKLRPSITLPENYDLDDGACEIA